MSRINTQVIMSVRPEGLPGSEHFELRERPCEEPQDGQVLVETRYISMDPAMRGWMREGRSYLPPVGVGELMRAEAVGQVLQSRHPDFSPGDHVAGLLGVQLLSCVEASVLRKVDASLAPLSAYLGVLGMPGLTAYYGLLEVGALRSSDTVLVSGAAGAVGSVVGQLAKLHGARVVGIAGGPDKCRYLIEELGYDAAIDYKNQPLRARIRQTCPKLVDLYFDNVGGEMLDLALASLAVDARVVLCGAVSQYNQLDEVAGPKNYISLIVSRARMQGFVIYDYAARYSETLAEMAPWVSEGKLRYRETVAEGIENFVPTFRRLFTGEKLGKLVLKVS